VTNHPDQMAVRDDAPHYVAAGRNGTHFVDQYQPNTPGHATYGYSIGPMTGKLAREVAGQLNAAYSKGLRHATAGEGDGS
jgi:hypothetical protein